MRYAKAGTAESDQVLGLHVALRACRRPQLLAPRATSQSHALAASFTRVARQHSHSTGSFAKARRMISFRRNTSSLVIG